MRPKPYVQIDRSIAGGDKRAVILIGDGGWMTVFNGLPVDEAEDKANALSVTLRCGVVDTTKPETDA